MTIKQSDSKLHDLKAYCKCGQVGLKMVAYLNPGQIVECPGCLRLLHYDPVNERIRYYLPEWLVAEFKWRK